MSLKNFVCRLAFIALFGAGVGTGAARADEQSAASDRQLKNEVEQVIRQHAEFGYQLTISTRHGVVYVGGTPWTSFTLGELESILRATPGVAGVVINAVYICA
jgi:hypothetical protein